ncbi:hypothetical protein DPEC_G00185470 [Dallia pectoralis]|uniref:Uncharacterized protein n=1 Tax=Dallia pectoralis TaxID=75939 RepID=A0ACC2GB38_DALPE|nr:hypothetical protein DPEC_G00185470 [Dallia pectoralis]
MPAGIKKVDRDEMDSNIDCPTYANVEAFKHEPSRVFSQHSVHRQWWKRPSGVAAVCLALLCILLLAVVMGLSLRLSKSN